MLSNVIRAVRWQMMMKPINHPISFSNSFMSIMAAYLANTAVPRLGEFVRAGSITRYEKVPFEKAFGTIILGRVVDFLCLLGMIGLGLVFHYEKLWTYFRDNLNISTATLIVLISVGILALGFILIMVCLLNRGNIELKYPILQRLARLIKGFLEGLGAIRKLPNVLLFVAYSIGIWLCYYLMHYLAFFAYSPTSHLGPADGLLVFDFGSLGVVFPSPGGMGSYHAMIVEALEILAVDPLYGFSFAMITFFTLTIFCNVFFGVFSFIFMPILNRNRNDARVTEAKGV